MLTPSSPLWIASFLLIVASSASAQQNPNGQLPVAQYDNPLPLLLRDAAVLDELDATDEQRSELAKQSDRWDTTLWPARNQGPEQAQAAWTEVTMAAQNEAARILTPPQRQRLEQIILWLHGSRSLLRDDVAERLALTSQQRNAIRTELETTQKELAELARQAADHQDTHSLRQLAHERQSAEHLRIVQILDDAQERAWVTLVGPKVDVQKLGFVSFRAPPLIATDQDWLNQPAALDHQQRRVTVIHFFANACVNCQRNYSHYRAWDDAYRPKGLVIIGIHTPETEEERDRELLQQRIADANLHFPILIDNENKNWDAWGNSMWPTVYLVDHHGRIRYWWQGELNWQSADGERQLRQRIEELLSESD